MTIVIIIVVIVQFGPTWFLFSAHGCKGKYLTYLINCASGLSFYGSRGSLFFFLRPASSLDVALDPQYNMKQYNKMFFIQISNILLQDSETRWNNDVLHRIWSQSWCTKELLEVENADDLWSTKKSKATNGRREDYVRLPFVDDLCLQCAMQDFLRRKSSSQAKLTRRQIKSS